MALSGEERHRTRSSPQGQLTFDWDLDGDGTFSETGAAAARGNETGISPTFNSAGVSGFTTRVITLRVTDNGSLSNTATSLVTITNVPPTANAGGPYSVSAGASVGLSGTGSDPSRS